MIRVITISREFGSGGGEVARILAERLEWKLIDDPLVAEIAQRANVPPSWRAATTSASIPGSTACSRRCGTAATKVWSATAS
jgi:hypothetical protein